MKIAFYFILVVCCGAAEGFTEKVVDFGENVTLHCDVAVKDVYWYLIKLSETPVFILRTFSSRSLRVEYSISTFSKTFSVQYNGSLFIHSITTDELGVYYCNVSSTGSPQNISNGIRLYTHNHSAENHTSKVNQTRINETYKCGAVDFWRSLFITLGTLNCLILIIGCVHCRKISTNNQVRPPEPAVQQSQHNNNPIYELPYTPPNGCTGMNMPNSTYVLLQPVKLSS